MNKVDEIEVDETNDFSKDPSKASVLVAFYNIQDTMTENRLSESISGLSEANVDFRVEAISSTKVAVIAFLGNIVMDTYLAKKLCLQ